MRAEGGIFATSKLKREICGESPLITPQLLHQLLGRDPVEGGQIRVEHYTLSTNEVDQKLDLNRLQML